MVTQWMIYSYSQLSHLIIGLRVLKHNCFLNMFFRFTNLQIIYHLKERALSNAVIIFSSIMLYCDIVLELTDALKNLQAFQL